MSNFFEVSAFTKHRLDTFTDDDMSRKECVSPNTLERRIIYEWVVLMFQEERQRVASETDSFSCAKSFTMHLKNTDSITGSIEYNDYIFRIML